MAEVHRGRALLPDGTVRDMALRFDGPVLVEVREPRAGDPDPVGGLLIPGLVNAHTHLELSWLGPVAGGQGLPAWVEAQWARRGRVPGVEVRLDAARSAARGLVERGTAAVGDVAAELDLAPLLARAGLAGIAWRELIGHDPARRDAGIADVADLDGRVDGPGGSVRTRAAAHAPYSTHPDLARAALAPGAAPATVHLAEDPAELTFLAEGSGPWAAVLDRLGVPFDAPVGGDPVGWLEAVGGLRDDVLAVHAVHLGPDDPSRLAAAGTPVVLCPRSNLWIGRRLPDVAALLAAGVPLALGTDSLASSPDLDVLGEVGALVRAFPVVDAAVWLLAATRGGADALGLPHLGRLAPGAAPGLLHLDADLDTLHGAAPHRRWRVRPGRPSEVR